MIWALSLIYSSESGNIANGRVDLTSIGFNSHDTVALDGQWEFYWGRLLLPRDFAAQPLPSMDSLIKVPGSWDDKNAGAKIYPNHGVATYRLLIKYPVALEDPALNIKTVSAAYKLFANGQQVTEVGQVSDQASEYRGDYKQQIVALPAANGEIELIFQVANLSYIRGGLRDSLTFGSKQVLEQQKMLLLAIQLLFIGSVFGFGIYYLIIFVLYRKNYAALLFSVLCFLTALRASLWGETPLMICFPQLPIQYGLIINYFTEYSLFAIMILFVISLYPLDYYKRALAVILLPSLFFEALLLAPAGFRASLNNYFYLLVSLQLIYVLGVLIKAVWSKRDNALLMLMAMGIFVLTIVADQFHYQGMASLDLSYAFLYGNFVVIIAMAFIQARQQVNTHQKLVLYNAKLMEADRLKDKIMATEMSFLQAQIKPHFLYNALSAIANVCEKDGKKASKLIIDLALYLRASLEFNHVDKMTTLEKELEFVQTYFNIEQARFGEKIQLRQEIAVPLDYQMPVLILQPLVENAVRHGISKKNEGGTVDISMIPTKEGACLEIKDDGVGMDAEKLSNLFSEEQSDHVGLHNIQHRLLRLYGKGLTISSEAGRGTCVRLVIPEGRRST